MKPRSKPGPARSPYITREGWERLNREQDALWRQRREVVQHLAAAAAEGDRSENAEYIYRKKQLREMDRRIRYLQKRLPELKVVDRRTDQVEQVYFGAWVELENPAGEMQTLRIVGTDEFDPKRNWISVDSPMARALLKRQVDDEISIDTPGGRAVWLILGVNYASATDS
ncbi:MAG: transcription elongation factor GreB [Gammaproteobacteria bacterium]|nr:transcription elongation factor GreB [Gammaproteobacteria bacterium]